MQLVRLGRIHIPHIHVISPEENTANSFPSERFISKLHFSKYNFATLLISVHVFYHRKHKFKYGYLQVPKTRFMHWKPADDNVLLCLPLSIAS
jgi:hypothetical protein